MQCSGTAKSTGKPCGRHARKGKKYCSSCATRYAGTQNAGPNNGQWRGAGRSSFLPKGVLERCQWLLQQPDLYDLTAEIVLLQTQLTQTQEMLAEGEPFERWAQFRTYLTTLNAHVWNDDETSRKRAKAAMYRLQALVQVCCLDVAAKKEIQNLARQLGDLQDKQAKVEKLHGELVPMNQIRAFFAALLNTTYNVVPDDLTGLTGHELRLNMARTLRRMFNRPEIPEKTRAQHAGEFEGLATAKTQGDVIQIAARAADAAIMPTDEEVVAFFNSETVIHEEVPARDFAPEPPELVKAIEVTAVVEEAEELVEANPIIEVPK